MYDNNNRHSPTHCIVEIQIEVRISRLFFLSDQRSLFPPRLFSYIKGLPEKHDEVHEYNRSRGINTNIMSLVEPTLIASVI